MSRKTASARGASQAFATPSAPAAPLWPAAAALAAGAADGAEPAAEAALRASVERARRDRQQTQAGLTALARLAEALHKRLGAEAVLRWLGDGWLPPAQPTALADVLLLASAGRPEQDALLAHLVAQGHPQAILQLAEAALLAGDVRRTLQLCQRVARLPEAQALAAKARQTEDAAAQAALATVGALVDAGLAVAAQALLAAEAERWQHHPHYVALRNRIREAEAQHEAEQALDSARAALLAAARGEAEAEAEALPALARWSDATPTTAEETDAPPVWQTPAPGVQQLLSWWPAVRLARRTGQSLAPRALALPALRALLANGAAAADAQALLARLPDGWRKTSEVLAIADDLQAAEAASWDAALRDAEATVAAALDSDDPTAAQLVVEQLARERPARSRLLEPLRREIAEARQRLQRREQLHKAFVYQLEAADWFAARRSLGELRHVERAQLVEQLAQTLSQSVGSQLLAQPLPPVGLQVRREQPIALAKSGSKVLLVQGRLWLGVLLHSGGVQPFALPDGFGLEPGTTRLHAEDDGWAASGIGGGQLLRVRQAPGRPPEVCAGIALGELLQGDSQIVGLVTPPVAPAGQPWGVVSRANERAPVSWTRLDGRDLGLLGRSRAKPDWWSVALDNTATAWGIPAPQTRAGFALARLHPDGAVQTTWRADDLGESIAALTSVAVWPAGERTFARFASFDPYDGKVTVPPSLLVLRGDTVTFVSSELKRRFLPLGPGQLTDAWCLDGDVGTLWFALRDMAGGAGGVLAVDARTLRPRRPLQLDGGLAVLALAADQGEAAALAHDSAGGLWLIRLGLVDNEPSELTRLRLPL